VIHTAEQFCLGNMKRRDRVGGIISKGEQKIMMCVKDKRFDGVDWSGSGWSNGGLLWHDTKFL